MTFFLSILRLFIQYSLVFQNPLDIHRLIRFVTAHIVLIVWCSMSVNCMYMCATFSLLFNSHSILILTGRQLDKLNIILIIVIVVVIIIIIIIISGSVGRASDLRLEGPGFDIPHGHTVLCVLG